MAVTLEGVYRLIDRASPQLDRIERRAHAADRALEKLGRTMDKIAARAEVQKLAGLAGGMDKVERSTGRVERVMAKTGVTARVMNRDMDTTSRTVKRVESDMGRLETVMRKVLIVGGGLGKVFGTLFGAARLGGMAALVQPAIGAIQALGAGAIALVQQAGQATGAIVPLIARLGDLAGVGAAAATVMVSIKAAALVTKFAMAGVTQAIHGNVAAFKLLTPQARAFVLEMRKLQPLMNTIRRSAQTGLFAGLTGAVRTARQNGAFQAANQAAGGIGGAVGGLAQRAASQLLSPSMLRDLVNLSGTAQVVISRLGGAAINLAQAFVQILVAAQPLTRWLVRSIDHWSKYLLQQTKVARASGALTRYFEGTRRTMTVLGHVIRDFGMGFINVMRVARGQSTQFGTGIARIAKTFRAWTSDFSNQARIALWFQRAQASARRFGMILVDTLRIFQGFGKASQSLGQTMVGGIEKTMRRWANWSNSFTGQNALSRWFDTARVTLKAMWTLISDIGGAFNRLGMQGGGAANLLNTLDKLVPDLERVLRTFGQQLGPGLFATVAQLAHLLATITAAGGSPLGMMLSMTAGILTNVNHILDRFHMVRTAVAIAVTAIGGALLLRKLAGIAGGVSVIAAMWAKVTGNTIAAGEAAAGVEAITRGGVATGMGRAGTAAARVGSTAYAGPFSGVGVVGGGAAAGAARSGGRIRGMLGSPRFGMGVGIGLPVIGGIGAQALAGQGVISQGSANTASGVLAGAGSGAMLGSMFGPWGTAGGAIIGGAAGFLGSSGSGGPSPRDAYLASLARTAAHTGTGFDINQMQGGAQNLAQANAYQRVLDQSLEGLQRRRNAIAPTSRLSVAQAAGAASVGGVFAQAHALDQQIAANQSLRHLNISRLGVERSTLAAQKAQTEELRKQARARAGRSNAARIGAQYMQAYNVYRQHGWSVDRATQQVTHDMTAQARASRNPAFVLGLARGGSDWLRQMKKQHPELKKEYEVWNTTMKKTLDKMGVTVVQSGGKLLKATSEQWVQIRDAMSNKAEQARQNVNTSFTQLQQKATAILVGLGYSQSQATRFVQGMDAGGGAGPSLAAIAAQQGGGGRTGRAAHRARGGRIPGVGLEDTVPVGGAMAAPGELIVNRHTEARVNRLLGRVGTNLGALVAGEHRGHAQGFQKGGRAGATIGGIVNSGNLGRTDMGVDFRGAGGVPAFADGIVTRVDQLNTGNSGWPGPRGARSGGFVNYRVTSGPARGRYIYVAENLSPNVKVGQHIRAGQQIATAYGASPYTEMGWSAAANGTTLAHATSGYTEGQVTNAGRSFLNFLNLAGSNAVALTPARGGARGSNTFGTGAAGFNPLMPALNYSAFGAGLGGVPLAASLQVGRLVAAGLQGKINRRIAQAAGSTTGGRSGGGSSPITGGGTASQNQRLAQKMMLAAGWGMGEWGPLQKLWTRESGFNTTATGSMTNLGRAYGIPQSLPGSKMASAGPDWKTNPATQIKWGLGYIRGRYHSPSAAWAHSESHNPHWYSMGGRLPEWGGWHAGGLDRTFDRPTMIGVGDKGRERVTVTPQGGGGARGVTINMGGITINGGDAGEVQKQLDYWAEELARMLERQPTVEG